MVNFEGLDGDKSISDGCGSVRVFGKGRCGIR